MSDTVAGFGCGAFAGGSGSAGLLLGPEAVEDVDRAVVFFATEVVAAGFGEEERGVLVAIQSGMRGCGKRRLLSKNLLGRKNQARVPSDMARWAAA